MTLLRNSLAYAALSAALLCGSGTTVQACDDDLTVISASASGSEVFAAVANSSSTATKGYLILSVTLRGRTESVAIPISVPAQGTTGTTVTFAEEVQFTGGDACEFDPGGNTESPDPVIVVKTNEEQPEQ